jgi:hypothetical protein
MGAFGLNEARLRPGRRKSVAHTVLLSVCHFASMRPGRSREDQGHQRDHNLQSTRMRPGYGREVKLTTGNAE